MWGRGLEDGLGFSGFWGLIGLEFFLIRGVGFVVNLWSR